MKCVIGSRARALSGSAPARGGTVRRGVKRVFQRIAADVDAAEEAELRRLEDGDPGLDA